jgi:hypothetical protein
MQCGIDKRDPARGLPVHPMSILDAMLTRSQVAARLGKSIATVRRLEGVHLHPTRDAAGVHRFERDEVEQLASAIARREVTQGGAPQAAGWKGWLAQRRREAPLSAFGSARQDDRKLTGVASARTLLEKEHAHLRRCTETLAALLLSVTTARQKQHLGPAVLETLRDIAEL